MKKSLKKIFLIIIPYVLIFGSLLILSFIENFNYNYNVKGADVEIVVNEDGTSTIKETFTYIPDKTIDSVMKVFLPISDSDKDYCKSDYMSNANFTYSECYDNYDPYEHVESLSVFMNGKKLEDDYYMQTDYINIVPTDQPFVLKIEYQMDKKFITKYNDLSVFRYNISSEYKNKIEDININIILPQNADTFDVNINKLSYNDEKIKNNLEYNIYKKSNKVGFLGKLSDVNLIVYFDSDVLSLKENDYTDNVGETELSFYEEDSVVVTNFFNVDTYLLVFLIIIFIYSLIELINRFYLRIKNRIKNKKEINYFRDVEKLISPELASTVYNEKFNIKTFIMSTVLKLSLEDKVSIIDNTITVLKIEDLSSIEVSVLELFLCTNHLENGYSVTFDDIRDNYNNNELLDLKYRIKDIKQMHIDSLYNYNIYDNNLRKKSNVISDIAYLIIILMILLPYVSMIFLEYTKIVLLFEFILLILLRMDVIDIDKLKKRLLTRVNNNDSGVVIFLIFPLLEFVIHFNVAYLFVILIFIINICILRLKEYHVLTDYGNEECIKLNGLCNFIMNFSTLEEKQIDDVYLWEKYLVYATAFGVPNKITKKFPENLVNMSIILDDTFEIIASLFK